MSEWIFISIAIFLCLSLVILMIVDDHTLVVRSFYYEDERIEKSLRAVFLTDLHSNSFGKGNQRLIAKIDALEPDIILIAGDLYTAHKNDDESIASNLLLELGSRYQIYYAIGNHELKTRIRTDEFGDKYKHYFDTLKQAGIHCLENDSRLLEDSNIRIYGLDLPFVFYKKKLHVIPKKEELIGMLGSPKGSEVSLMLAHNPEYLESYSEWGADLVLSGHYHGGIMRLPKGYGAISPRFRLLTPLGYGAFKEKATSMYLSCGLGNHTLPIRLFNPGEITLIEFSTKH